MNTAAFVVSYTNPSMNEGEVGTIGYFFSLNDALETASRVIKQRVAEWGWKHEPHAEWTTGYTPAINPNELGWYEKTFIGRNFRVYIHPITIQGEPAYLHQQGKLKMTETINALLIGRHTGAELPGVNVVEQRDVFWDMDKNECRAQWRELLDEVRYRPDNVNAIVLQNVPGILASVLATGRMADGDPVVGIVIQDSKPEMRREQRDFPFQQDHALMQAANAVKFANGRAEVEADFAELNLVVGCSIPQFKLHHIEWL